jgi:hypothetical protein
MGACCSPAFASSWLRFRSSSGCSALADEVPAVVLGLIIAVVDMAAFGELYVDLRAIVPDYFAHAALLLGAAAAPRSLPRC